MTRDALVVGISGTLFGLIVGWILGSQMTAPPPAPAAAVTASAGAPEQAPPPLDVERAADLERRAKAQPADAGARVELANLYYDARRFDLAIPWYEAALALDAKNVNASTDLAISYYYTNQIDRALAQIDKSLAIDPGHVKTLFNQGVIRAWGREDLTGAIASWERVVALDPNGEDGRRAKAAIDTLKSHPPVAGGS